MKKRFGEYLIVINEPIIDKHRRRLFEKKVNEAALNGYEICADPHFYDNHKELWCSVVMRQKVKYGIPRDTWITEV